MRKSLIIALVALIVGVAALLAQADPTLGERIIAQEKAKHVVIPYLSHGEGVVAGEDGLPQSEPTVVIPYLSHGEGLVASEDGIPAPLTAIEQILAQERGRHADSRVFGPAQSAPVLVAGPADGFDVRDAGLGGAATLALALLVAAAVALRSSRRRQATAG